MAIDLTGMKFGRLVVISRADDYVSKSGKRYIQWNCKCDCGNTKTVLSDNLKHGRCTSCGCLLKEMMSERQTVHGKSKTKLYGIWSAIKRRCYNRNEAHYDDYGGRGVSMCKEWKDSYEVFESWAIDHGFTQGLTIDRIDVNGNYEPSNCRWVNRASQANNRRSNVLYTYNGETHNIKWWSDQYDIPYKKLYQRLAAGWDIEKAITT